MAARVANCHVHVIPLWSVAGALGLCRDAARFHPPVRERRVWLQQGFHSQYVAHSYPARYLGHGCLSGVCS